MLVGYLKRYAEACHSFDVTDEATRINVGTILIPKLMAYRRELVEALMSDRRWSKLRIPRADRIMLRNEATECSKAVRIGIQRLGLRAK